MIEEQLERIANALEHIATKLDGGVELEQPAAKPAKADKPAPAKAEDKKTIGNTEPANSEYTKDQVREALQDLQKATSAAKAKSILKEAGASTLGQLPEEKYHVVMEQVAKAMPGG